MIDNRILIDRVIKELRESVFNYGDKLAGGNSVNLCNLTQITLLFGIVNSLNLNSQQDGEDLILEVFDHLDENSSLCLNINTI